MIESIFKRLIKKEKPFSTWQIELTTRCALRCKMCVRTESKEWQYQDMRLEDFEKILPYLRDVENVILEGWGESLLYKDLPECIRLVKKEGPCVGFVTSGKGLTEERVSQLIDAGLDFVGFSIAGTRPESHARIRVNSHLSEILNAIQFFTEEKRRRGITWPKMHLVFLMLKDNIHEVPDVPVFAKEAGIEEVFLTHIIHITSPSQDDQKAFSYGEGGNDFNRFLREAEANARRSKVKIKRPGLSPVDVPVCEENPLRNLYISSSGEVSPCVYLYPPLPSPFKRIFCGGEYWQERVSFGNIFKTSLSRIWLGEDYLRFRDLFAERQKRFRELYFSLWDSPKARSSEARLLPEPPQPCRTCHKILGL
ncbi:MAG: SPASM domain-containing protein [Syntrophaceae bacterium]|nr:SPASM domain-containing protein [Syntrophaceae bacterium]